MAFLWKVSLKIVNSGMILKTFTHAVIEDIPVYFKQKSSYLQKVQIIKTVEHKMVNIFWVLIKDPQHICFVEK